MNTKTQRVSAVPTNIITGFLGAGKTSTILHLLESKPENERWAVLVNEFGEIGVDGSLFEGHYKTQQSVFIREVPGGCMCCAAGLPMQIALNQLLMHAKPDRLLIEPTGLGHPKEILQVLSSDYNSELLDLQKTLTLVDARKLSEECYTNHLTFNQQIAIADIVVGNKMDLYEAEDQVKLIDYVKRQGSLETEIFFTKKGKVPPSFLDGKTTSNYAVEQHTYILDEDQTLSEEPIPDCGYLKATNEGEGFKSIGWRFSPLRIFNHQKLFSFLSGVSAERMKAVFITERGVFGYNLTSDALTEMKLDDSLESRIEIIADQINNTWETQLMACTL